MGRCKALGPAIRAIKMEGLSIRKICTDKAGWKSVSESKSQWKGEGKMGGSVREEMKYGEMVTHSSGGKALIYSLCLFWVILWVYEGLY